MLETDDKDIKRKEALKELLEEEELARIEAGKNSPFRLYKTRDVVGGLIFQSLMGKRKGVDESGKPIDGFYLTSKDNEVGLMSMLYGVTGLLSLVNRYEVKPTEEHIEKIKSDVKYIIEFVKENGYDLSPYLDPQINKTFFRSSKKKPNSYVGVRTWALSLFVSARRAHLNNFIIFDAAEMENIMECIKSSVEFFVNSVIWSNDNKPEGWGYANDCMKPSLFFTYSVVEAFSDFEDNCMLGNKRDSVLLGYINRGNGESEPLEEQFQALCFKIGDKAWDLFKEHLENEFFSDNFDECISISRKEVLKSSRSSVLFNSLYVILILFYSYKTTRNKEGGRLKENDIPHEQNNEVRSAVKLALQMIQNFYDDLESKGIDSIVDRHIIAFDQKHIRVHNFGQELNEASIQASSLLPMLAKANNLIALHIYKYPQQKMSELLDRMLGVKLKGAWLWENRKYDLLSTERYLEAIADFFDYHIEFERHTLSDSVRQK